MNIILQGIFFTFVVICDDCDQFIQKEINIAIAAINNKQLIHVDNEVVLEGKDLVIHTDAESKSWKFLYKNKSNDIIHLFSDLMKHAQKKYPAKLIFQLGHRIYLETNNIIIEAKNGKIIGTNKRWRLTRSWPLDHLVGVELLMKPQLVLEHKVIYKIFHDKKSNHYTIIFIHKNTKHVAANITNFTCFYVYKDHKEFIVKNIIVVIDGEFYLLNIQKIIHNPIV